MTVQFFDSMTRSTREFVPLDPEAVTLYTCGPTVYDYAHIGNFRAYIFEDLLHRVLRLAGFTVRQVMNLTDVDDKTIRNANEQGVPLDTYTQQYKDAFFQDLATLNITPSEVYPAATDHIPEMVEMIETLLEKGFAYKKGGSVYYSIDKFKEYGKLAHLSQEDLLTGASGRVDSDEYEKDNISDFVLWKEHAEKDGPIFWETTLGKGRPGWHIECSAMSMKYLGQTIDIHTGGSDNLFPHHQNEIAQSEACTGKPFVNYWLHCAYLIVDGEKMSKSSGNFYTFRQIMEKGYSPEVIRYLLLATHYRRLLNFSFTGLQAAASSLARINGFIQELIRMQEESNSGSGACDSQTMLTGFKGALFDDLNISEGLAAVFTFIKKTRESFPLSRDAAGEALAALQTVDTVLGVLDFSKPVLDADIEALIQQRLAARKNKDFATSDRIRDELAAQGIILKDTPDGSVWERQSNK